MVVGLEVTTCALVQCGGHLCNGQTTVLKMTALVVVRLEVEAEVCLEVEGSVEVEVGDSPWQHVVEVDAEPDDSEASS